MGNPGRNGHAVSFEIRLGQLFLGTKIGTSFWTGIVQKKT